MKPPQIGLSPNTLTTKMADLKMGKPEEIIDVMRNRRQTKKLVIGISLNFNLNYLSFTIFPFFSVNLLQDFETIFRARKFKIS